MSALVKNTDAATQFSTMLEKARPRLEMVIPKGMSVDRVVGVMLSEFARNPRLRECEPGSVVRAVVQATELGLDPSPKLGQVWLIPRWNPKIQGLSCEMQVGWKGIVKKAYECERILSIDAVLVHERDVFELRRGTDPKVVHVYNPAAERGGIIAVYFAARLTPHEGDIWRIDDMSIAEVHGIRDRSDGWKAFRAGKIKSNPWQTDEGEMIRKTMLIRGLKTCPISDSFRAALDADADDMQAARADTQEATRTDDLKAKLGVQEGEFDDG